MRAPLRGVSWDADLWKLPCLVLLWFGAHALWVQLGSFVIPSTVFVLCSAHLHDALRLCDSPKPHVRHKTCGRAETEWSMVLYVVTGATL